MSSRLQVTVLPGTSLSSLYLLCLRHPSLLIPSGPIWVQSGLEMSNIHGAFSGESLSLVWLRLSGKAPSWGSYHVPSVGLRTVPSHSGPVMELTYGPPSCSFAGPFIPVSVGRPANRPRHMATKRAYAEVGADPGSSWLHHFFPPFFLLTRSLLPLQFHFYRVLVPVRQPAGSAPHPVGIFPTPV